MIRAPRRYWHEPRALALWLVCLVVVIWRFVAAQEESHAPDSLNEGTHQVRRIVDGDTLLLESGARVRLQGIDAPETVRENWPVEPWGPQASAFAKDFIDDAGKQVRITFGLERKYRFDRYLAFVWNGDEMLNEELVRAGLARARLGYRYSGLMKRRLAAAEKEAKAAKRGIWSKAEK